MTISHWLIAISWTYALFAVQASGVSIPLVFPAAIVTATVIGGPAGLIYAAATGLLSDALTAGALGMGLITYTLSALLLQRWAKSGLWLGILVSLLSGVAVGIAAIVGQLTNSAPVIPEEVAVLSGTHVIWSLPASIVLTLSVRYLGLLSNRDDESPSLTVRNRWRMLTN